MRSHNVYIIILYIKMSAPATSIVLGQGLPGTSGKDGRRKVNSSLLIGQTGEPGLPGRNGRTGYSGHDGLSDIPPILGVNYFNGFAGPNGLMGNQGLVGAMGDRVVAAGSRCVAIADSSTNTAQIDEIIGQGKDSIDLGIQQGHLMKIEQTGRYILSYDIDTQGAFTFKYIQILVNGVVVKATVPAKTYSGVSSVLLGGVVDSSFGDQNILNIQITSPTTVLISGAYYNFITTYPAVFSATQTGSNSFIVHTTAVQTQPTLTSTLFEPTFITPPTNPLTKLGITTALNLNTGDTVSVKLIDESGISFFASVAKSQLVLSYYSDIL